MGISVIKDGQTGNTAKVGSDNRLQVKSVSVSQNLVSSLEGKVFDISSGKLNLADSNEHAMLYIENDEGNDIVLDGVFVDTGISTNGVGFGELAFYFSPNGGTLITEANDAQKLNRRVGDSTQLAGDYFSPTAPGKTISGGSKVEIPGCGAGGTTFFPLNITIPKGQSFGFSYTPPISNTGMDIQLGVIVFKNGFLE